MLKRICFFIILLVFAGQSEAQTNTNSPYSRYGLGMMSQPGFTQNRAMGGAGIALSSDRHINYLNPASYSATDSMSFLFDFGIQGHYTLFENRFDNELRTNDYWGMNMDHLAIAFPITKWWAASFGVVPYSKVGYSIKQEIDDHPDVNFINYYFEGNGGINQLYLGTSFEFFDRLSLGINFNYLFGSIEFRRAVEFPFPAPDHNYSFTEINSRTVISDFMIDMGIQYSQDFLDKYNLTLGFIVDNKSRISADHNIQTKNVFPGSATAMNESTITDPSFVLEDTSKTGNIIIPGNFGAGFAFNYNDRLTLAVDYYRQDWSKSSFFASEEPLTNSNSLHGGLELIPDPEALKGYHKRMAYRLGGYHKNSYLHLKGEQLKDYGISFGLGLPLRNTKSSFNLAFEAGRRGTLDNYLIRENYMFVSFSVTLHDFWFVKRRFD